MWMRCLVMGSITSGLLLGEDPLATGGRPIRTGRFGPGQNYETGSGQNFETAHLRSRSRISSVIAPIAKALPSSFNAATLSFAPSISDCARLRSTCGRSASFSAFARASFPAVGYRVITNNTQFGTPLRQYRSEEHTSELQSQF